MAVHMSGTDARAWVRGEKPWDQFLIYCDRLGSQQGTELWAAYLTDERLFSEYRKALANRGDTVNRPGLFGFDRVTQGLLAVQTELAALHQVMARNLAYPLPKGPLFPAERFAEEDTEAEVNDLMADIESAWG
jgi:hypothetical protein